MTTASADEAIDVLFIGGAGRCGSTLLDRLLGQSTDVFAAGEMNHLWTHALAQRGRCGCGTLLTDCPVWSEVLRNAFDEPIDDVAADVMHGLDRIRTRYQPVRRWLPDTRYQRWLGSLPRRLGALYTSVARTTGASLIVDASKDPAYAQVIDSVPGFNLKMVHLVRDPRAAAFSWQQQKTSLGHEDQRDMHRAGVVSSTMLWLLLNRECRRFGLRNPDRYLLLRYEDFAADPRSALESVSELVGRPVGLDALGESNVAHLDTTHSAWGNANRFGDRTVPISPDERWITAMQRRDRSLVSALTTGTRERFGYR